MTDTQRFPTELRLSEKGRRLAVTFEDGERFDMSAEYLRVHSPSAEVRGHGPGQEVLQRGKENVAISRIEPIGNYAVRLVFDDGHDTGLYSWKLLYDLGCNRDTYWDRYQQRLAQADAGATSAHAAPAGPTGTGGARGTGATGGAIGGGTGGSTAHRENGDDDD